MELWDDRSLIAKANNVVTWELGFVDGVNPRSLHIWCTWWTVGDESDGVVDGDIYYCDMIFLTWISKHKKKDLYAVHGSFLFMGVCHTTMEDLFMGPIIIFLSLHGKNFFFEFIDFPTQYFHALTISLQWISPQKGKLFFRLHGTFLANYYDGDSHIFYEFRQVFCYFLYAQLIHPTIYYLLVDVVTYRTSHLSRNNLPRYCLKL